MSCSRDCKKFGLAALAAAVSRAVLEMITHGPLLGPIYHKARYLSLWNPEDVMHARMPWVLLAHAVFGLAFAKIYAHGYEDGKDPKGQGLRFGLLAGLLLSQASLIQYAVYPVSFKLALAWAAADIVQCALIGIVVAAIYRPAPEAPHV